MPMTRSILAFLLLFAVLAAAGCATSTNSNNANISQSNSSHDMSNMANHDMSNMSGHDMSNMSNGSMPMMDAKSAPGAAEQPYDLQFIDSMIHHHEGAVVMAKMIVDKTKKSELKAFAQKIIDDQSKEIDQMKQWRQAWYPGNPSALNLEMPGMKGGMEMMNSSHMKDMDEMEPAHLDNHFLTMMTLHHQGAVAMGTDALKKAEHPELKAAAQKMITAQQAEIKQMEEWKKAWGEKH